MKVIDSLVFEGGGIRGIASVGALHELYLAGRLEQIKRVAGVSAGAIIGMLYAIGYSTEELHRECLQWNFNNWLDCNPIVTTYNLFLRNGIYTGDKFIINLQAMIEAKGFAKNITFAELNQIKLQHPEKNIKDLYIIACNISTTTSCILSHESEKYKDLPIVTAVRMSMSIPGVFVPVIYKNESYVDGGLTNNYPLDIFSDARYNDVQTLGIRLDFNTDYRKYELQEAATQIQTNSMVHKLAIVRSIDFWKNVLAAALSVQEGLHRKDDLKDNMESIVINTGDISSTDFGLQDQEKNKLFQAGAEAAAEYLSNSSGMTMLAQADFVRSDHTTSSVASNSSDRSRSKCCIC